MKLSNYHVSKFVLDIAATDHAQRQDAEWAEWFKGVSRIYNHRMPESVVKTLLSYDIPSLSALCQVEMKKIEQRRAYRQGLQEKAKEKHEKWIKRRDAGNAYASSSLTSKPFLTKFSK